MTAPIIANYDPRWPGRFSELAGVIRAVVDHDVVRLDHTGSTSVPGLGAKDVIDIQVTVRVLDVADGWPDRIGPFERRPDVSRDHVPPACDRGQEEWMKRYWSSRLPPAHLHVREEGRLNQRYALLFRDYLRAHPSAALPMSRRSASSPLSAVTARCTPRPRTRSVTSSSKAPRRGRR